MVPIANLRQVGAKADIAHHYAVAGTNADIVHYKYRCGADTPHDSNVRRP